MERTPEELVALRKKWAGASEMALSLQIDRSTLWKYENAPQTAPEGFWGGFAAELDRRIGATVEDASRDRERLTAAA